MAATSAVIEEFRTAIQSAGLRPPAVVEPDGKMHRFSTDGTPGDDAGWYVCHSDGVPAGSYGDWRTGVSETWHADVGRRLTSAEKVAHRARLDENRREREAEEVRRYGEAREQAARIWNAAMPAADDHAYFSRKQVRAYGLRVHADGRLIVPVRDDGELHSLQFIDVNGDKRFLPGGRVKGCYHVIGTFDEATAVCIAEGYATGATIHAATGYPVAVAFNAGNLAAVVKAMRARCPELRLILCADDDIGTNGNPGLTKATEAARAVGGWLAVPDFGADRPAKVSDFNELMMHRGLEAVAEVIMHARPVKETDTDNPPVGSTPTPTDVVSELLAQSGLSKLTDSPQPVAIEVALQTLAELLKDANPLRRAIARGAAVELLKAKKVMSPTALVDAALGTVAPFDAATGQGTALTLTDPDPWPEPVNGAELLDEIAGVCTRHVVLPAGAADAVALWVLHTYLIIVLYVSAILALTSPQKRCGKSTLLDVLRPLVRKAVGASNISASALFRIIEMVSPTLLIDEADTFLADHEELRGILNAGHSKTTAVVIRSVGDDHEPRMFGTFCPKAIAAIGTLPGTIEDRAIIIRMQRRAPGEYVQRLRRDRIDAELLPLRRRAARWAADNKSGIRDADPDVPNTLNDRASDNWRPLLAIADAAGGDWPDRARKAALTLSGESLTEDADVRVQLLSDLRDIFTERDADKLASETIVEALVKLETRPWAEWRHGKPLKANGLARLLKPFSVQPKTVRIGTDTPKGYDKSDLLNAWHRYLPSAEGVSNRNTATIVVGVGETALSQPPQAQAAWRFEKPRKPLGDNECGGVADETSGIERVEI